VGVRRAASGNADAVAVATRATTRPAKRFQTVGSARLREALVGYSFVLLPMGFFLLFFIFPIGYAFYISFYDWGILGKLGYVGFRNYTDLWHDQLFWTWPPRRGPAVWNTLYYTAIVVPCQMALGLSLALIVNARIRGKTFFRASYYFPSLTSSAASAAIAIYILSADGLLNKVLGGIEGHPVHTPWFAQSSTALESIMGLNIWLTSGTIMLFYLATLQSIPTDVYEAAAIDAASRWRIFWRITFPLLKPGHFFVAVLSVIGCLKIFDQAFIVSGGAGGPAYSTLTAVLYLYQKAINDAAWGYAAAMGVVLFIGIFVLTLVQRLLFGRSEVGY
jgi:ABC-type sugar transport system permease subunit